jgi:aryl-alcohol dehydrogenase-like predicted oxidoreductase
VKLEYLNRVVIGGWQLAEGHSVQAQAEAVQVIEAYYAAGFRVFDCADIYTGVEQTIGDFIRAHGLGPSDIKVHTKYVPDMTALETLSFAQTEAIIDRSRARLGVDQLDLVQFHWWHYPTGDYLTALDNLKTLRELGKLREIGLTNFSAERVQGIVERGIPVASIQVQYSVLDQRAKGALERVTQANDIALLCYGSVAGGLLSDRYLNQPAPAEPIENRSLTKYLLIVEELGGWQALQSILRTLREIADAKGCDIASVAAAYCLAQPVVRACIIGARHTRHLDKHIALRDGLVLANDELTQIEVVRRHFKPIPGEVYDLERDVTGKHGRIMKYNLNTG